MTQNHDRDVAPDLLFTGNLLDINATLSTYISFNKCVIIST